MSLLKSLTAVLALSCAAVHAGETEIRKSLLEHLPGLTQIDEVRPAPMPGLWEIRIGTEIRYTDAMGNFLIEGDLFDLHGMRNLTEERINKITAVDFNTLPFKDAVVWKTGNGKRRLAVFADPNCGYCKRFERALQQVKDVTVYTFVIPILGGDSPQKANAIWCAKDPVSAWRNWMLDGTAPPHSTAGGCDDAAIERNLALSRKNHVNGTPSIVFEDGTRAPGALTAEQLEHRLQSVKS